jgi:hypothetical protein
MASADASGTEMVEDQRSYIKIETLLGKTLQKFTLPCMKFVMSTQWAVIQFVMSRQWAVVQFVMREWAVVVSHWATHFRERHVTINDDPRPGKPKTSTYDR